MAIERLLYRKDWSDPYGLGYADNTIIADNAIIAGTTIIADTTIIAHPSIRGMFKGNGDAEMGPDRIIPNRIISGFTFRMGWDTAVVFEKEKGGPLSVKQVYNIKTGQKKGAENVTNNTPIYQITTQAVDTCTLVYIETDKECLLAHFGPCLAGEFKMLVKNIFPETSNINFVLYSGGGAKAYQEFGDDKNATYTQRGYNSLVQWMSEYKTIVFDRMAPRFDKDTPKDYHLSHMEFGIGWDGSVTTYFGDIVRRMKPEKDNPPETSWRCCVFGCNDIEELGKMREWAKGVAESDVGLNVDSLEEVKIVEAAASLEEEGMSSGRSCCCNIQ